VAPLLFRCRFRCQPCCFEPRLPNVQLYCCLATADAPGCAALCHQVDPYGVSKVLEKDDHESSVLGALIRWVVHLLIVRGGGGGGTGVCVLGGGGPLGAFIMHQHWWLALCS
jgi:hypothetical protein